jgi:hypothetical protein
MRCISAESRIEYGANSCMRTVGAGADCTIILPDINLINGIQNRTFYYGKLADELLRYTRVRRFILSGSASMMSLTPVQYDLNPDEIILFHSQLDAHFENLEPGGGSVARYNTFYTANPDLNPREIPSNQFTRAEDPDGKGKGKAKASVKQAKAKGKGKDNGKEVEEEEEEEEGAVVDALCAPVTLKPLSGRACAHYFPASMKLLSFENAAGECTFEAFLSILREERAGHASTTVHDLKAILVSKYRGLVQTHKVQMMNYYKHLTANRTVLAVSVDDFIMNAFHYMTHLDLWILAQQFRIPIVLFSAQQQHPLVENRAPALVLYHDADVVPKDPSEVQLYYVMSVGRQRDVAPVYSVVRNGENELKFSLSQCTNAAFVAEIMKQVAVFGTNPNPGMDWVDDFVANYVPAAAKRIVFKEIDG